MAQLPVAGSCAKEANAVDVPLQPGLADKMGSGPFAFRNLSLRQMQAPFIPDQKDLSMRTSGYDQHAWQQFRGM
jgi:hypothetical protein